MGQVAPTTLPFFLLFVASLLLGSCSYFEKEEEKDEAPELQEPKQQLTPPPEYTGPIDPEWPPSRPGSIEVALEASRIYRQSLAAGGVAKKPNYQVDGQGYYVERGKVGDFNYIEVVLGKNAHPDHPMPLIVILHGRGGHPTIPHEPLRHPDAPSTLYSPGSGQTWKRLQLARHLDELRENSIAGSLSQRPGGSTRRGHSSLSRTATHPRAPDRARLFTRRHPQLHPRDALPERLRRCLPARRMATTITLPSTEERPEVPRTFLPSMAAPTKPSPHLTPVKP